MERRDDRDQADQGRDPRLAGGVRHPPGIDLDHPSEGDDDRGRQEATHHRDHDDRDDPARETERELEELEREALPGHGVPEDAFDPGPAALVDRRGRRRRDVRPQERIGEAALEVREGPGRQDEQEQDHEPDAEDRQARPERARGHVEDEIRQADRKADHQVGDVEIRPRPGQNSEDPAKGVRGERRVRAGAHGGPSL